MLAFANSTILAVVKLHPGARTPLAIHFHPFRVLPSLRSGPSDADKLQLSRS